MFEHCVSSFLSGLITVLISFTSYRVNFVCLCIINGSNIVIVKKFQLIFVYM